MHPIAVPVPIVLVGQRTESPMIARVLSREVFVPSPRPGVATHALDATNNDESVAAFRGELLDCAAATSE